MQNEKITLTKEEKELCDASPIEAFLYYLYYPKQLLKDATSINLNPYDLFLSSWSTRPLPLPPLGDLIKNNLILLLNSIKVNLFKN